MGECEHCGETMEAFSVNVEAFELTGQVLCETCADEAFEEIQNDNGQFGLGA